MKKYKVIIDTDPGVDDTMGLIMSLFDKQLDIKLFTVAAGNISTAKASRNMCHLLDIFNKDFPVAVGPKTAIARVSPDASWLHGEEGLGAYIPPKTTKHKPIKKPAYEAMYDVIKENPHEIIILGFAPHTNIGLLFKHHPDAVNLVKEVIFEGASPFGLPNEPDYISFNASTDPEALKIVLDSGVKAVMVPSNIGRFVTHFAESDVDRIEQYGDIGKLLTKMFQIYWLPNVPDKRISTNDSCALVYLLKKHYFKTRKAKIDINITDLPGKCTVEYCKNGNVLLVENANRKKFLDFVFKKFDALLNVKLDPSIYNLTIKKEREEIQKPEQAKQSKNKKNNSK